MVRPEIITTRAADLHRDSAHHVSENRRRETRKQVDSQLTWRGSDHAHHQLALRSFGHQIGPQHALVVGEVHGDRQAPRAHIKQLAQNRRHEIAALAFAGCTDHQHVLGGVVDAQADGRAGHRGIEMATDSQRSRRYAKLDRRRTVERGDRLDCVRPGGVCEQLLLTPPAPALQSIAVVDANRVCTRSSDCVDSAAVVAEPREARASVGNSEQASDQYDEIHDRESAASELADVVRYAGARRDIFGQCCALDIAPDVRTDRDQRGRRLGCIGVRVDGRRAREAFEQTLRGKHVVLGVSCRQNEPAADREDQHRDGERLAHSCAVRAHHDVFSDGRWAQRNCGSFAAERAAVRDDRI